MMMFESNSVPETTEFKSRPGTVHNFSFIPHQVHAIYYDCGQSAWSAIAAWCGELNKSMRDCSENTTDIEVDGRRVRPNCWVVRQSNELWVYENDHFLKTFMPLITEDDGSGDIIWPKGAPHAPDAKTELDKLRLALEAISEGTGRFSRDPLKHAENTIDDMKSIAKAALKSAGAASPSLIRPQRNTPEK